MSKDTLLFAILILQNLQEDAVATLPLWFWITPSVYACQTKKNVVLNFFKKAILQYGLRCEMWLYILFLVLLENKGGKTYRELLQQTIVYQFAGGGFFFFFQSAQTTFSQQNTIL